MQSDIIAAIIGGVSSIIVGILGLNKIDRNSKSTDSQRVLSGGVFVALMFVLLCVFIIGVIVGKNVFPAGIENNQSFIMELDGENVVVTPEKYEALYNEKKDLEQSDTTSNKDNTPVKSSESDITPVGRNNEYLIYFLEPYQTHSYTKVIDNSMKMGGKNYNHGFQLQSSYGENNALFNFEGKYKVFSGIIGCDDKSDISSITVEFYGDNVLITSMVLNRGDLPRDLAIDISGVSKFEIKLLDNFTGYVDFAELKVK